MIKNIYLKSSCIYTLKAYSSYLEQVFKHLSLNSSIFYLPRLSKKITLLKSPHVFKKAKEQFELREYKAVIKFEMNNCHTIENVKYALFNKPKCIKLKIKS